MEVVIILHKINLLVFNGSNYDSPLGVVTFLCKRLED